MNINLILLFIARGVSAGLGSSILVGRATLCNG